MQKNLLLIGILFLFIGLRAVAQNRWTITDKNTITWKIDNSVPHADHIEMSGKKVSVVVRYGVNKVGGFEMNKTIVWPMLRTIPNNTHASLTRQFKTDIIDRILINGKAVAKEQVKSISHNGLITVKSELNGGVELIRILFPSVSLPAYCENYTLVNKSSKEITIEVPNEDITYATEPSKGVEGSYHLRIETKGYGAYLLSPQKELSFGVSYSGWKQNETIAEINPNQEIALRSSLVDAFRDNLVFESPDSVLNTAFAFAKIRTSESIYETKGGFMHGPGGESYYAAIWANDQAEYVGPFFPYLGYDIGNKASLNAYLHFARFMNAEYKPIPSSIIAEGTDIWNGAGDRGDAAMIAYGAARYALVRGDKNEANQLWPLIEWCLEYCKRKVNQQGVVSSDADELEGRFPSGKANLCTSSLYYDALNSAVLLGKELQKPAKQLSQYVKEAKNMNVAIEKFFGATIDGFSTYRYYEENKVLRSWICVPLTVGIFTRKEGTIGALFSPKLWTNDGLATQSGDQTFWDRSTLYALRGVFAAGETEKAFDHLKYYSNRRLLGEHVPYPVEAYPEGGQRHLAAESGLYCRIFTEGLFGLRPTGLHALTITPRLPKAWNYMMLKKVHSAGQVFDINVYRVKDKLSVEIKSTTSGLRKFQIKEGTSINLIF